MKPFRFNLQAVLTLRQRAEQKALEKYASALVAREQAVRQLDEVRRIQNEWWTRRRQQLAEGCAAGTIQQWASAEQTLKEKRNAAEVAVGQAEVAANQALQAMLSARRDRETVEKHQQKQRSLYNRELIREEQKALDDLANRRVLCSASSTRGNAMSYE